MTPFCGVALLIPLTFTLTTTDQDVSCDQFNSICGEETSCRDCIRRHPCCIWCYDKNFTDTRCFPKGTQNTCQQTFIEYNFPTSQNVTEAPDFSDVETDINEAVQLSPHTINVNLRYGDSINVSVKYRPAKNYPLQLYYLMDLTKSMQPDLETLKSLGSELTSLLITLTKHHSIAFGSYIDKPSMPFYDTAPFYVDKPCRQVSDVCDKAYVFKHRLNFTENVNIFIEKINGSRVSANFDDPEGGMDAVMQILLCGKRLGWTNNSRKLILLATEGTLHFGGDGILAGFVERNTRKCKINSEGDYDSKKYFDYPSIEELYYKLKKKKTNMIVAAKNNSLRFYEEMKHLIPDIMFVGELENKSTNVLDLVREGYFQFIRQVNLFPSNAIKGLKVEMFVDCDGDGAWKKKSSCANAEEGKEMEFLVQLTLEKYQDKRTAELVIEESNIHETVKINVNFIGSMCECSSLTAAPRNCFHGMLNCGKCLCDDGWIGDDCAKECKNDVSKCRFKGPDQQLSLTCSGQGECHCSRCRCASKRFQGEFCEIECPFDRVSKKVCAGHGNCVLGKCTCRAGYIGKSCGCHTSTENCKIPGSNNICNNQGNCSCNRCLCSKNYWGRYCELCSDCNKILCSTYEKYVIEHVVNHHPQNGSVRVEINEDLPEELACVYQYFVENKKCRILYNYRTGDDGSVLVKATEPNCSTPIAAGMIAGPIIGVFLALAVLIALIWKGRNMLADKREYQKYEKSLAMERKEQNPLYKNPVVTYKNPMGAASGSENLSFSSGSDTKAKML